MHLAVKNHSVSTMPGSRNSATLSWQFSAIHQHGNVHPHLAWKMWCETTADDGLWWWWITMIMAIDFFWRDPSPCIGSVNSDKTSWCYQIWWIHVRKLDICKSCRSWRSEKSALLLIWIQINISCITFLCSFFFFLETVMVLWTDI